MNNLKKKKLKYFHIPNGAHSHQVVLFPGTLAGGVNELQFWCKTFFTTDIGFLVKW